MSAVLMKQDRPRFASGDLLNGTPEEIKAAFEGFDAYYGTIMLDEATSTVTHHVEACRFPQLGRFRSNPHFELSGTSLRIYTQPMMSQGKNLGVHVVWERK